ncbi:MAG: RNA polymerase sigma-70 factor [Parafilimonas sp.]|nr:RNA polymerase sigma-70 factor [Parafilimonas sp.]
MDSAGLVTLQQRICENDETALAEIYKLYYQKLVFFAKSILRTKQLAEEVVEDVLIKLWCNRSEITKVKNLNIYLYTAVKNTSLNLLSQQARQLVSAPFDFLNIELENELANPQELMITTEMMKRMHCAVDTLPPRCKMIFRLVREDGLKYKEVAEILNISVNTIDVQMAIAVKKICTALNINKPFKQLTPSLPQK